MSLEVRMTCPLGSDCEKVVGEEIHRCRWYVTLEGADPQNKEKRINDSRCAMEWIPIINLEGNGLTVSVAQSIQSLRNETVQRQQAALEALQNAKTISADT